MRGTQKQEKGITLIALVLTIIILIILAAVSIATLTGDNGILTKAQEAREATKKAEIEEQLRLAGLSAKIKKEGGDITIEEYLQELREEKVDFVEGDTEKYGDLYEIYKKVIIVEGKYIYGLNEKDGDVIFEEKGTENKIKPTVKSIEIIEKKETTIKVKVTTLRNVGGKLRYYIKEENVEEYDFIEEQEGEEYTFKNLDQNKTYSKIKVEAIAPNGETAYLEKEISNVPSLAEEGAVTLSYRANGQAIGADTWTKGPVTVTVKVNSNINMQGYTLQTAQSTGIERTGEIDWKETANQIFTTKGTIYARLIDKTNGSKGKEYTKAIDKIDTTVPTIDMEATQKSVTVTTNSITITASATDAESGIAKYSFSRDDGANWIPTEGQTEAHYTFQNLEQNKPYRLKIKVTDYVGNEAISGRITETTGTVPNLQEGDFDFAMEAEAWGQEGWTNKDVTVTATPKIDITGYRLQSSKDGKNWDDDTSSQTFKENGTFYVRLWDGTNWGASATANVDKIDKQPPQLEITISYEDVELYEFDKLARGLKSGVNFFASMSLAHNLGDYFWGDDVVGGPFPMAYYQRTKTLSPEDISAHYSNAKLSTKSWEKRIWKVYHNPIDNPDNTGEESGVRSKQPKVGHTRTISRKFKTRGIFTRSMDFRG